MVLAGLMLVLGGVVLVLVVLGAFRSWTREDGRTVARLRSPEAHKVSYDVPEGQDPAVLVAALHRAGFTAVMELGGGADRLVVECDAHDRERVRQLIEQVDRIGFDGVEMHVQHARFDEDA